jgi:Zn-dependent protease
MSSSIRLGTFRGIPIGLHWSVVLVAVLFFNGLSANFGVVGGIVAMAAFFASILLHEIGHALTARRFGVSTESIELWALGGVARLDREAPTARAEGWIAAAGPLTSLGIGAIGVGAFATLAATGVRGTTTAVLGWLGVINGVLALFNLLPGLPLDGGRMLRAWRWGRHGDRWRASQEASNAGRALGWTIAGTGVVLLMNGHPGLMLVVTGAFIAMSARAEGMAAAIAERLRGVRVGDLTWFGVAHARPDTDVETMLWQRSRLGEAGVVAVSTDDRTITGLVDEDRLWALPEERRESVSIESLMVPLNRLAKAEADEDLGVVLGRLDPSAPIVTVWRQGRLVGVVPKQRLLRRLQQP